MNINKIIAGYREAFGEKAELSHSAVPLYHTMRNSCLFDTYAWGKIRERING